MAPVPLFWPGLLLRNLIFLVIVLAHGFRRLLPPYQLFPGLICPGWNWEQLCTSMFVEFNEEVTWIFNDVAGVFLERAVCSLDPQQAACIRPELGL